MKASGESMNSGMGDSPEVTVGQVRENMGDLERGALLVDIREQRELSVGRIDGALHLPYSSLRGKVDEILPNKNEPVVLYCATGSRSLRAASLMMEEMGYRSVKSMTGGYKAWVEAGFEVKVEGKMPLDSIDRYSRQMLLDGIGEDGQLKLLQSKVLIVGAGGLGSPVATYLAAGGIGLLGIVDSDTVSLSNIHRQVLYSTTDVGRPKTESAMQRLRQVNPEVSITVYQERFEAGNALKIVEPYEIVVDGSDNASTKFLLNDAAFFAGKPYVFGGAVGFNGQASVFFPKGGGPCLRCMFPEIPPPDTVAGCSEVGVLGPVPGQIGMVQAGEVFKSILGIGRTLMGRFLIYDCLQSEFRTFTVSRDPSCPLCGENPLITDLSGDYSGVSCSR
jgi:molybdopterin/thiamine biosynthesis adenylyltransferase/rhodanese-related sulfurtransferase